MNTATVAKTQAPDVAGQITYAMRTMGVAPIPRNYQLFYEAYIGSNPTLTRELAALGNRATQRDLDEIGAKYFANNPGGVIEGAHSRILAELDALLKVLKQEQTSLESYNRLLGETYSHIENRSQSSADIIQNAIGILSEATGRTMAHGQRTVMNVNQRSAEMDQVRRELDEYKRIANTDSLTRLSNRRAFDDRLASIYDNPMNVTLTALIVIDVDHFKRINDMFGHPVGDKILASVAGVIRSHLRKEAFVARAGGEEFAVVLEGNTAEEISAVCERLRSAVEATPFRNSRTNINYGPITVSIGFCMADQANDPGELYSKADIALYCAKESGRNRSVQFSDEMKKEFTKGWLIYK
ncbi:GGDEF domain-containing protein [Rhizobiaceae bacterium BDR2-2]|uniref:diguanylate cyclase n=1 Tax=Ectorhizobium quercum TaxID=2965071 RepID=A0AAE3SX35_9HYPH|nr:GGDEF domain-containing protein [Ectorhizobium quercum]MCX8999832.1 GGDEF domain-containing protein [Ectorhizobium quercum]